MRGGIVAVLVIGGLSIAALPPAAAAEIKPYEKVAGEVSGSLKCVGSDTMNNLVAHWAEGFKKFYPSVQEGIEGKGSASGPPALTEGTSTFGPMSRDWKPSEIDTFKEKHGYAPTVLPTAIDMLAVFVHKDNPLKGLSLQQVDAIFSKNRNGGAKDDVRTWGDLGLEGEWKDKPIRQAVASDKFGLGYSGIGYATADVRAVPLAPKTGADTIPPESKFAYSGEYPLARLLYMSVNYKPGSALDPLRREFIKYILSGEGQADVKKDGYLPVTGPIAKRALDSVGLGTP